MAHAVLGTPFVITVTATLVGFDNHSAAANSLALGRSAIPASSVPLIIPCCIVLVCIYHPTDEVVAVLFGGRSSERSAANVVGIRQIVTILAVATLLVILFTILPVLELLVAF